MELKNIKQEAIKRMKMLRLMPCVIKEFEDEGILNYSEMVNRFFDGMLFHAYENKYIAQAIDEFNEKNIGLPYHAQLTHTRYGDLLAILFVPYNNKYWTRDINDLKEGCAYCYVANLDEPLFSDFGTIEFASINGGITRVR